MGAARWWAVRRLKHQMGVIMTIKGMDRRGMLLAGVAGFTLLSGAALAQEAEEPPVASGRREPGC